MLEDELKEWLEEYDKKIDRFHPNITMMRGRDILIQSLRSHLDEAQKRLKVCYDILKPVNRKTKLPVKFEMWLISLDVKKLLQAPKIGDPR